MGHHAMDAINEPEIWVDIANYEGHYQISNMGNVKSLSKKLTNSSGVIKSMSEKIIKGVKCTGGYFNVVLCRDNTRKTIRIHQLVAMAFLGHEPCGSDLVVDHIDGDRANNNIKNIRIITTRENTSKKGVKSLSKHTGVHWCRRSNKWNSRIYFNKKRVYLGSFASEDEAGSAYQDALSKINKGEEI